MKTKTAFLVVAVTAVLVLVATSVFNVEAVEIGDSQTPVPTLTVIEQYSEVVHQDNLDKAARFSEYAINNGSPDYSGLGYETCEVDSDCLSGIQTCEAGIIPNTIQDPGYCVP